MIILLEENKPLFKDVALTKNREKMRFSNHLSHLDKHTFNRHCRNQF